MLTLHLSLSLSVTLMAFTEKAEEGAKASLFSVTVRGLSPSQSLSSQSQIQGVRNKRRKRHKGLSAIRDIREIT